MLQRTFAVDSSSFLTLGVLDIIKQSKFKWVPYDSWIIFVCVQLHEPAFKQLRMSCGFKQCVPKPKAVK